MDFTGLSEQEARTLGDTINNNLKKNEKNAIDGIITLDDNLINLSAPDTKVAIDALPATLFDHPTEEIIPLPDPFADQPYDITKYNYNTSKIEKKSGYRFTGKNLAITAGIV